jgi:hypothetical protein
MLETIFVVMKILKSDSLRADVAATERIVFVSADVELRRAVNRDLDTADRFAEIATAIVKRAVVVFTV